jgi:hypothetical protein
VILATTVPLADFPAPRQIPVGEPALVIPGHRLRPCRGADLPFLHRLYRHSRAAEMDATGWPEEMKRAFCRQQFDAQHTDYMRRFPMAEYWLILRRSDLGVAGLAGACRRARLRGRVERGSRQ